MCAEREIVRNNLHPYLFASERDSPHKAPAALSWRPGEEFEHEFARAT